MKAELDKQGIALLAISSQGVDKAKALAKRLSLTLPVLADPDRKTIIAWGLEDKANGTAWPAMFAIDRSRKIRWRNVSKTYPIRPTEVEVGEAIKSLTAP